jgi:hypothetical protein
MKQAYEFGWPLPDRCTFANDPMQLQRATADGAPVRGYFR